MTSELAELRELLLGPEQAAIEALQERFDDPKLFAEAVGSVLAEAIRLRASGDPRFKQLLERIVEDVIRNSVRRNPAILTDALFPIISGLVRKSVATALRGMMESIDQLVEQGFSRRAFEWRIEAFRTGRPFGEIVLLRSTLYRVEQVFLIHRKTGLLLSQRAAGGAVHRDADLIAAMMTAIQDFVTDSFGKEEGENLESFRVGECAVWIESSPNAVLAGVVRGVAPARLRRVFQGALERISSEQAREIEEFDGDTACFQESERHLDSCLLGRLSAAEGQGRARWPWVLAACVLVLGVILWSVPVLRERSRWSQYLNRLKEEPGIVLTEAGRAGGKYYVSGLRDPLAADPDALLRESGIDGGQVRFQWEPYVSLQPALAAARRMEATKAVIEKQTVRFPVNSARISAAQVETITGLVSHMRDLLESARVIARPVLVEVIGHADFSGDENHNNRLAGERADAVLAVLVNEGLPAPQMQPRGAGSSEPLRPGDSELDKEFNRSVSFRVLFPK